MAYRTACDVDNQARLYCVACLNELLPELLQRLSLLGMTRAASAMASLAIARTERNSFKASPALPAIRASF